MSSLKSSSIIHTQPLEKLSESKRPHAGEADYIKRPTIVIDMRKIPVVSKERWESLGREARNQDVKLRSQTRISLD